MRLHPIIQKLSLTTSTSTIHHLRHSENNSNNIFTSLALRYFGNRLATARPEEYQVIFICNSRGLADSNNFKSLSFQDPAPALSPCPSVVTPCEPAPYTDRSRTADNRSLAKLPHNRLFVEVAIKHDATRIWRDEEAPCGFCLRLP